MSENNSVFLFVQKTSNDSRGRPNLRIDMNLVTDLKSLCVTWKNSKFTWSMEISRSLHKFLIHFFFNLPFYNRWCCKTSIWVSCWRMIHQHQPYEALCFCLPSLYLLCWGTVFLTLVEQVIAGFLSSSILPCSPNL